MNCSHCTTYDIKTKSYKPTKMYHDRILVGGGCGLERFSGTFNDEFSEVYKCWQCGQIVTVEPKPIPYGELVKRENKKIKAENEYNEEVKQRILTGKRGLSNKMAEMILEKYRDSVRKMIKEGSSWDAISKLLSFSVGRKLSKSTLQTVWGAYECKGN